ncbi:hypothetical protein CO058_01110 [candidate division WWE3 bacterium CG_4_9_14_0_2_um_filter_35_11]|uniref:Uncharacterized protein n=1 Tax=candidate division WWE3 bacterium CG_4_9_14_0_2_um_filter_35_11 TaxID=1975077 RepID=A0A2M8EMC6_UNCKA|nr:MAG: hypothetical protein COV25_03245 [candidate division WWE3 bacterium CG10_big_fil_rev_8_21_14_0_10_35_32]PJC23878.1 MAG: hypothetical protein CO058_01110 [candidate division WWE3 bacterium CG_4_9_14_0_2_um_filter_35_11]
MEPEIQARLDQQDIMLNKIYVSVEKTRKYFLWTFIISILVFVLPMIVMAFVLPSFMKTLSSSVDLNLLAPQGY